MVIELVAATSRRQTTVTSVIPHSFIVVCRWTTSVELSTVRPPPIESYSIATVRRTLNTFSIDRDFETPPPSTVTLRS